MPVSAYSLLFASDAKLGPFEQRFHVTAADVSGEQLTGLTVTLVFVNAVAKADPMHCIVAIGIDPIGVKTGQHLVDGDARQIIEKENYKDYISKYLHSDLIDNSLLALSQVGVCVLLIFREIFPERFELLGVSSELSKLREGL